MASSVIIIGAGLSGLTCANRLKSHPEIKVVVLEAENRIGGRLYTYNGVYELGGSWVHGIDGNDNPLVKIAEKHSLTFLPTAKYNYMMGAVYEAKSSPGQRSISDEEILDSLLVFDIDGTEFTRAELEQALRLYRLTYASIQKRAQKMDNRHVSLDAVISEIFSNELQGLTPRERRLLDWMFWRIGAWVGGENHQLSVAGFCQQLDSSWGDFPGAHCLVKEGMSVFPQIMAEGVDIRLQEKVTGITLDQNGKILVEATKPSGERREYWCDRCVITVSLGVLKANQIRFNPPLPEEKQGAISRMGMGLFKKVILRFPHCFWPEDKPFFGYCPEVKGEYCLFENYQYTRRIPVLQAPLVGDFAATVLGKPKEVLKDHMMRILGKIFQDCPIPEPEEVIVSEWDENEHFMGSYSYCGVSAQDEDLQRLAAPIQDRLFFSGEATHLEYEGSAHAAYYAGIQAAEDVIKSVIRGSPKL